jgi:methionyl-tRNA synthetase
MVERYRNGIVPAGANQTVLGDASNLAEYERYMGGDRGYLPHEALRAVFRSVARANEYVDREAPWKLAKAPEASDLLDEVLATLIWWLAWQAVYLAPFMPNKCAELWRQLGAPGSVHSLRFDRPKEIDPTGWQVTKGPPLFPKVPDATGSD